MNKNNSSLFDKLTIVIPTHYRHKYLERILEYYKDSSFKILVADSTNEKFKKTNQYKVDYFHYPDSSYHFKMNKVLQKVTTKYCVFCADDDFIAKESLFECVEFLEEHNDYSCVQGRYVGFDKYHNGYQFRPLYFNSREIKINNEYISVRLKEYMENYFQLFYAVHKKNHIKSFFYDCCNNKMYNPILSEIGLGMYALISGKYKSLETFYSARDQESVSSDVDRTTLDLIIEDLKYKEVLYSFFKMTSKFILSKHSIFSKIINKFDKSKDLKEDAEEILNSSIRLYCDKRRIVTKAFEERKKLLEKRKVENSTKIKYEKKLKVMELGHKQVINHAGYPVSDKKAMKNWCEIKRLLDEAESECYEK